MSKNPLTGVYNEVVKWHYSMLTLPTWEELIEIEYVRRFCNVNMFTDDVEAYCKRIGLLNASSWYNRCAKVTSKHPSEVWGTAVKHYEKTSGPQSCWMSEKIRNELDERVKYFSVNSEK